VGDLSHVHLVGRQRELAAVARLLDRARDGHGGQLLITGPPGAGRTALLQAAADLARDRHIPVTWLTPCHADLGTTGLATMGDGPRLLLVDDLDHAAPQAAELLERARSAGLTLLATAQGWVGPTAELRLRALTEAELAQAMPELPADAAHGVWLLSSGLAGHARALADELSGADGLAVLTLALNGQSRAEFLQPDVGLIRLLEESTADGLPPSIRARTLARLARELLADPSAAARRRQLADQAVTGARSAGDPAVLAEVLDSWLHALWDPAAASERLSVGQEIVRNARLAGDNALELRGLFWSFIAWMELADIGRAEAVLATYARTAELAGDAAGTVTVLARRAMLATIRGRFDAAEALADQVAARGRQAGLSDTDRLVASVRGQLELLRGTARSRVDELRELADRLPGHFYEATLARTLAESGRETEAALELTRLLPGVLAGSGPRWLGAAADLAIVAVRCRDSRSATDLYNALLPYQGRLVVWGGANTVTGPADHYLGRLATCLGREADAERHFARAIALAERIGALPWLAAALAARAEALAARSPRQAADDARRANSIAASIGMQKPVTETETGEESGTEWRLSQDAQNWRLEAGSESVWLRDTRGVRYLRTLLRAPREEVSALDLVSGDAGLVAPPDDVVLDEIARAAYQKRLRDLTGELDAADRAGDGERSARAQAERNAVAAELRRATGLGGRRRNHAGEAERARVNATRALWATVAQVEAAAPLAGAHLRASLRTGRYFRYQPVPGGPTRWRT
jgi:tetratricopeptide (TPR) repeat protein